MCLAHYAHPDCSGSFPGVPRIAKETGYSERQVQRILRNLELICVITAESEKTGGREKSTHYRINEPSEYDHKG